MNQTEEQRTRRIKQFQKKLNTPYISNKYRRYCINELRKLGVEIDV